MTAAGDRTLHARDATGRIEIVRYDRAGKWYIEIAADYGRPGLPAERHAVTVREAALHARGLAARGGWISLGLPGGKAFDRAVERGS